MFWHEHVIMCAVKWYLHVLHEHVIMCAVNIYMFSHEHVIYMFWHEHVIMCTVK